MRVSMVDQLLTSIADAGRELLRNRLGRGRRGIEALCRDLLSTRGEASGAALAREVVQTLRAMPAAERLAFFALLASGFAVDHDRLACRGRGLPRRARARHAPGPAPCHRGAPARAVPADEHGARRHPLAGPPARGAAPPSAGPSGAARRRCRPACAADELVQPRLPLGRPDRLEQPGLAAGEVPALREGPPHGPSGGPEAKAGRRPPLLCLLPSGPAGRASDLRPGGAGRRVWRAPSSR